MRLTISHSAFISLVIGFIVVTSCGPWCSACSSVIENKSNSDIYVILKCETEKFTIRTIESFAERSHINKYNLDTIKNTGIFVIPSGGYLETYDGPGNNPAKLLNSLKIITDKRIYDYPTQDDINNAWDKRGLLYSLIIKS